jgi:hypothetical protein
MVRSPLLATETIIFKIQKGKLSVKLIAAESLLSESGLSELPIKRFAGTRNLVANSKVSRLGRLLL